MAKEGPEEKKLTYLTEIKELPPLGEEAHIETDKGLENQESMPFRRLGENEKKGVANEEEVHKNVLQDEGDEFQEQGSGKRFPLTSKDIILGVVDIVSVILLAIILLKFPTIASELKNLRADALRASSNISYEVFDIDSYKVMKDKLKSLFLDEAGIVKFVGEVEKITKVSFTSQKAVKDKSGNFGLPVVFEFEGSWEEANKVMQDLDKLPFLFRVVKVEARRSTDDPKVIQFKYGVMLYVKDELGENR